jgi:hypothetical protein
MGLGPPEGGLVGGGVGHVQGRPVDRQHPPAPIPRPGGARCRKRPSDLGEQRLQWPSAKPLPGTGDRLGGRHLPGAPPAPGPRQPLGQQPGDLLVGLPTNQRQRQHQVDHHPGRQQPVPPLPPTRLVDHPVHQLWWERRGQHTDRDPIRQPLLDGRLDLAHSRHPLTSGRAPYQAIDLSPWHWA